MCGVIGVIGFGNVNQDVYDGLTALQHRGQDAAGIVTLDGNTFYMHKDNGLIRDSIRTRHMRQLTGDMGIGHVRYPTAGCSSAAEAQPFYVNSPFGIALAHNGNLVNTDTLLKSVFSKDRRHLNTSSDSEILTNVVAHELSQFQGEVLTHDQIFSAMKHVYTRCSGAFAVVSLIGNHGMIAFRDSFGIRPLIFGKRDGVRGVEFAVASESVALDVLGFEVIRDVLPGEVLFFPRNENTYYSHICSKTTRYTPCMFEHVYLARPDSMIDGVSVYKTRLRMGKYLAEKIKREMDIKDIDVIIPIPDSGRTSAIELAEELGISFREGFIKNRYIGRTFIMPGQEIRKKSIRHKLNPIQLEFKGKNVMLVDDSIVRGNTSKKIISMARGAGAKNVYFVSAAPQVKFPNVYGIDLPSRNELIAHGLSNEEIAKYIGADRIFYQDIDDLIKAGLEGNNNLEGFEMSVFTGEYVTGDITPEYLQKIELIRNDSAKKERESENEENNMTIL